MKNQYFADVNDYRKYGILRALSSSTQFTIGVCWMLTPDDGRTDGGFTEYATDPGRWRKFDPELFDSMVAALSIPGGRSVTLVASLGILPGARFHDDTLPDDDLGRSAYFHTMTERFSDVDLVFFDPDNGLEVESKPLGAKDSSKYLYWHEAAEVFSAGSSVLIYQHFPREKRDIFIERMARSAREHIPVHDVHALATPSVVYFLLVQTKHAEGIRKSLEVIARTWHSQVEVMPSLAAQQLFRTDSIGNQKR